MVNETKKFQTTISLELYDEIYEYIFLASKKEGRRISTREMTERIFKLYFANFPLGEIKDTPKRTPKRKIEEAQG